MWTIATILNFALCVYLYYHLVKKLALLTKVPTALEGLRPAFLPQETALWYLDVYTKVFKTQNLASVFSIMSDLYYHKTATHIRGLNKLGVRREITMDPFPPSGHVPDYTYVVSAGKAEVSTGDVTCNYREQYIDSTTEAVLYDNQISKTNVIIAIIRSTARTGEQAQAVYCLNCGAEVDTAGEIFVCKHCGTTYRSDSYDWVINDVKATEPYTNASFKFGALLGKAALPAFILTPILGLFAKERLILQLLVVLVNAFFLGGVLWIRKLGFGAYVGINKLSEHDPLAAAALIGGRADYLVRRMYHARDFEPQDIRTMMDPAFYQQWLSQIGHSGTYVLDVKENNVRRTDFYMRDGRQYLDTTFECTVLALTPQRQVQKISKKFQLLLYRNQNTRYEHMLSAHTQNCVGCGNSLDLTANGTCKFCGTEYDIADFDWKIAYVEPTAYL